MDDFFGASLADDLVFFHGKFRPCYQVQLLILWEFISCPYDDVKQEHGKLLKIISFHIDINNGAISLTSSSIANILDEIDAFLATVDCQPHLCEWQKLAGHLNCVLNVLPWGCLALSAIYHKLAGKTLCSSPVPINIVVRESLAWFFSTIP